MNHAPGAGLVSLQFEPAMIKTIFYKGQIKWQNCGLISMLFLRAVIMKEGREYAVSVVLFTALIFMLLVHQPRAPAGNQNIGSTVL